VDVAGRLYKTRCQVISVVAFLDVAEPCFGSRLNAS